MESSCPMDSRNLSGSLSGVGRWGGGGGWRGEGTIGEAVGNIMATSDEALLDGCKLWRQLSRTQIISTCSACIACSWVMLYFLSEKAGHGRASAGLNQSLLDNQEWLMAFSNTHK